MHPAQCVWKILIFALTGIILAGCTAQQQQQANSNINSALARLAATSIADLNAAAADAAAHNDQPAMACYPPLVNWIMSIQQNHGQPVVPVGAFGAFQRTRDIYKDLTGAGSLRAAIPDSVMRGCAWLFLDAQGDVLSFVNLLTRIASGTYVPPIPLPVPLP